MKEITKLFLMILKRILIIMVLLVMEIFFYVFLESDLSGFLMIASIVWGIVIIWKWRFKLILGLLIFNMVYLLLFLFLPAKDCGSYNSKFSGVNINTCQCLGIKKHTGIIVGEIKCIGKVIEN